MSSILKIKDENNCLELSVDNDCLISVWAGEEFDMQTWIHVQLNKEEVDDVIKWLQEKRELLG